MIRGFNIFLISCVLLLDACSSDVEKTLLDKVSAPISVSADYSLSRINYTPNYSLIFAGDDEMKIVESSIGDLSSVYYSAETSSFKGNVYVPRVAESGYNFYAAINYATMNATQASFTLEENQRGVAIPKVVSVANVSDLSNANFAFQQVGAFLSVTLNPLSTDGISSLTLESIGGESLVGTATYNFLTGNIQCVGTSNKVVVTPAAAITSGTTIVFNVLPVTLSQGAFLTITGNSGEKMRITLNYGEPLDFVANRAIVIPSTINQTKLSVEVGEIKSSYTLNGMPSPTNDLDGSTIYASGCKVKGISSYLVDEVGVYIDGEKITSSIGTDGVIAAVSLSTNWGAHTAKAYAIVDGTTYYTEDIDVAVTGIPYSVEFTNVSTSSSMETFTSQYNWTGGNINFEKQCARMNAADSDESKGWLVSPAFYVPQSISVSTSLSNVCCSTQEDSRVIYITNADRSSSRTVGSISMAGNYNGSTNNTGDNCSWSEDSGAVIITSSKPCLQYCSSTYGKIFGVIYYMVVKAVNIKYAL